MFKYCGIYTGVLLLKKFMLIMQICLDFNKWIKNQSTIKYYIHVQLN